MAKPIPTSVHGVLDYMTGPTLIALPRLLGWDQKVTNLLTAAGGVLAYSLLTRYELGLVKVLPMTAHLALDFTSGVTLAGVPFLFLRDENSAVKNTFLAVGIFEIGASLLTQTQPST